MLIKVILLFTIVILAVQGRISSSRIEADAAKWTKLHQEYMDRSPYSPFRGQMKTKCLIMLECCSDERDRFFDLMREHKFEETCINDRISSSLKSHSAKCKGLIRQLEHIKKTKDYSKFNEALSGNTKSDERIRKWRSQMAKVCSTLELAVHYCEPDDMGKFQSCQEKVLRMVARENDGIYYDKYVREMESDYRTYIQRLSKAFPYL